MDVENFLKLPVMGILRGISSQSITALTESIVSSGLKTIEITMNTSGASELIKRMVKIAAGNLVIGAGTVLSTDDAKEAVDSGATFIVSPAFVSEVMEYCIARKIPVFPGAFTPQEIYNAWQAGATMVKVFPAKFFGPAYFKEIKGPFNDIKLLACGGVNEDTVEQFFSSGAAAVAFGSSIFKRELIKRRDFSTIEKNITSLIEKAKIIA